MCNGDIRILLVEDDEVDVLAIQRALKKKRVVNALAVAKDGIEALEILRGENGHQVLPRPHIILLDLNMPRMNGLEFLEVIRADPTLHDWKSVV